MGTNKYLLLVMIILSGLVMACKNPKHGLSPNKPVTLRIWHYYNGPQKTAFDDLVKEFNDTVGREYGIMVEAFNQGSVSDLMKKISDSLNNRVGSDEIPDIYAAYADTAYEAYLKDRLTNLNTYMTKEEIAEYLYMEEGNFGNGGGHYLFPIAKSTEVLILNKTAWDEFVSDTGAKEEDLQTNEGITKLGALYYDWTDSRTKTPNDGKAFFGRDALSNYIIVGSMQLSQELFNVNGGEVTYNVNPGAMRVLWDNYYIPYLKGHFLALGRFRSDDMRTGDIIALTCSSPGAKFISDEVTRPDGSSYPIEIKAFPLPNFAGYPKYAVQQGAGMVINKSVESKEYASIVFLKWFTEADRNISFSVNTGYLPVKKSASNIDAIKHVMQSQGNPIDGLTEDVLFTALSMTNEYTLYTSKAFKNGNNAYNYVGTAMGQKATHDRAEITEFVRSGQNVREAEKKYEGDTNFEAWLESFVFGLNQLR